MKIKELLQEMPMADMEYIAQHLQISGDETDEGSFSRKDRTVIQKYMANNFYKERLKKLPFNLYVYIVDDWDLKHHGEKYPEGEIDDVDLDSKRYNYNSGEIDLKKASLAIAIGKIEANRTKDPSGVHFIMGDNYSEDHQMAPTPWIIAHRFCHVGIGPKSLTQAMGGLEDEVRATAKKNDKKLADIVSLKSVDNDKLAYGELGVELTTQYLVTGKIVIKPDAPNHARLQALVAQLESEIDSACKKLKGRIFYV